MSKSRGGGNPKTEFDESRYYDTAHVCHKCTLAKMGGEMVADAIMGQAERFDLFANLTHFPFPGGRWLRWPGLVAGMMYYSMLDRF